MPRKAKEQEARRWKGMTKSLILHAAVDYCEKEIQSNKLYFPKSCKKVLHETIHHARISSRRGCTLGMIPPMQFRRIYLRFKREYQTACAKQDKEKKIKAIRKALSKAIVAGMKNGAKTYGVYNGRPARK